MPWYRARLSGLAAGWLLCHLAIFVAAPVAIGGAGLAAMEGECDCQDGAPGASCPMHRSPASGDSPAANGAMRSACAPADAALLSLGLGLGILPSPSLVQVEHDVQVVFVPLATSLDRLELPDSPPPRG
jgi:hypothetical protein